MTWVELDAEKLEAGAAALAERIGEPCRAGCRRIAGERRWRLFFAVLAGNERAAAANVGAILALLRIAEERAS